MASNEVVEAERSSLLVGEEQDTATHARAFVKNSEANRKQQQQRPPYPSFVSHVLMPHLLRIPLTAAWAWAFHTFVMKPWLGPLVYYWLVEHPTVQRWVHETEWMNHYVWPRIQDRMDYRGLDRNDVILYSVGSNLVHILAYTLINGCYMTMDAMKWCAQYRIPHPKAPPPELIWDTLAKITETFLLSGPLVSVYLILYMSRYPHIRSRDDFLEWNNTDTPVLVQILHFVGMLLFTQFFFYWAHRGFHQVPGVYRRFHKQHHQYQATVSISAEYAHPLEQVIANFAPTIGYNLIFSHVLPVSVWFSYLVCRLHDTFETHSGYDFRGTLLHRIGFFCGGTYWHEYHHRKNRGTYGEFYLDWFFGTMDPFLADDTQRIQAPAQMHRKW